MIRRMPQTHTGLTRLAWLGFVIYATQGPGRAIEKNWVTTLVVSS